jgi:TRAP-type C4-dicarboxylate transport system substrate-binding protein
MKLIAAFALLALTGNALADEKIKLGTLAPNGSPWHTLLKEMAQRWNEASGGKVKMIVYAGGVVGNEGDMVKKTRINQLQAVAVTTIGLHDISPDSQAVDVPMLVDNFDLLDHVMERVQGRLEKALEAKGYVVLAWSDVGFVRFFSTKRYASYNDFNTKAKVFGWEGDPASVDAWRAGGFHPVVMSSTDIVPSLQTGLLDTVAMAPLYAFTSRIFEKAKYMLDLPWAVLTGATIIRKDVWDKIPADLQPKLMQISREYTKKINAEVRRMDEEALATMKTQGLEVVKPSDPATFREAAIKTWSVIRGKVVPADVFDDVKKYAEEGRAKLHQK